MTFTCEYIWKLCGVSTQAKNLRAELESNEVADVVEDRFAFFDRRPDNVASTRCHEKSTEKIKLNAFWSW